MYESQQQSGNYHSDYDDYSEQYHSQTAIAYDVQESKDKIKQSLKQMSAYGYDFKYKTYDFQQHQQYQKCSKLRHRAYLRHKCWRCVQTTNSKVQKQKRFTTSKGTVEIRYKFMKLKKFFKKYPQFLKKKQNKQKIIQKLKYPYILLWDFYIYHMKCKACVRQRGYSRQQIQQNPQLVYAIPYIYQRVLMPLIDKFNQKIQNLLNPNSKKKIVHPRRKGIRVPRLKNHKTSLCQACKKGICNNYNADFRENDSYDSRSFLESSSNNSSSGSRRSSRRPSRRFSQHIQTPQSQNNLQNGRSAPQSPRNHKNVENKDNNKGNNSHSNHSNSQSNKSSNNSQNSAKFIQRNKQFSNINLSSQLLFAQKNSNKDSNRDSKSEKGKNKNTKKIQNKKIQQKSESSYRSSVYNKSNKSENIHNDSNSSKSLKSQKSQKSFISQKKYVQKFDGSQKNKIFIKEDKKYFQKSFDNKQSEKNAKYVQKDNSSIKSLPIRNIKQKK